MIDIENEIFDTIADKLRKTFADISVYGEEVQIPSSFPCATVVEADNAVVEKTQDSSNMENHASLMYEVNVYSNKTHGKKTECKKIFAVIDTMLLYFGFTRVNANPQTMEDSTIYRMVGRYSAVVSKDLKIYRR